MSGRRKFEVSEMDLRNPCLDLGVISKVCFRGVEWSHREVSDFRNLRGDTGPSELIVWGGGKEAERWLQPFFRDPSTKSRCGVSGTVGGSLAG